MEENENYAPEATDAPQDGNVLDLSAFLAEVIEWNPEQPQEPTPEVVTEPKFFKEESETLSNDDILELDNVITGLEAEVQNKDVELAEAAEQLTQINDEMTQIKTLLEGKDKVLNESVSKMEAMERVWESVVNHPEIGKFVEKVARWEEVSISEYALRQIQSELDDLPEISATPQPSEIRVVPSMTKMLSSTPSY